MNEETKAPDQEYPATPEECATEPAVDTGSAPQDSLDVDEADGADIEAP
jgi:hypothetical protein